MSGFADMPWRLLLLVLIASCSKGPAADLEAIAQARSLGAEWALVNELAGQDKITRVYANTMRHLLREQLRAAAKTVTEHDTTYSREIQALLSEPDNAAPEELRGHVNKLKQIENGLESA